MKIKTMRVFQADLPLKEGRYSWSDGKYVDVFDSTVVELESDDGTAGPWRSVPARAVLPARLRAGRAGSASRSSRRI